VQLTAGRQLNHYRLVEQIGEGGMGVVWKATDLKLGRDVALKFLPADALQDPQRRDRFRNEARIAASLGDRGIVQIHELAEAEGFEFIVMEFIDGESLDKRIARGALPVGEALSIGRQVARSLAAAHAKGLVHRDIKPANVLITKRGETQLIDFGLAMLFQRSSSEVDDRTAPTSQSAGTTSGGTVAYMSPNRLRGRETGPADDIHALGVVLYEALSGRRPFAGASGNEIIANIMAGEHPTLAEVAPDIAAAASQLVERCIASTDPKQPSAPELESDLARLERALAEGRDLPSLGQNRWFRGRRRIIVLGGGLALFVLSVWGYARYSARRPDPKTIVVFPLEVTGSAPGGAYLGRMFADAIAVNLAPNSGIVVLPVPEMELDGRKLPSMRHELASARSLGAGRCLVGRVTRIEDSLQVSVDLLDGARGSIVWGVVTTAPERGVAAAARAISASVVTAMGAERKGKLYDYIGNLRGSASMAGSPVLVRALEDYADYDMVSMDSVTRVLCSQFPEELDAHVLRAAALQGLNDLRKTEEQTRAYLEELVELRRLEPTEPYTDILTAVQARYDGNMAEAIRLFGQVLARTDLSPAARAHALRQLGATLGTLGDFSAALPRLEAARGLDPLTVSNYVHLSGTARRASDYEAAVRYARQGLLLVPRNVELISSLGMALGKLNRWDEALPNLKLAADVLRSQDDVAEYAVALEHAGRHEEAHRVAIEASSLPPNRNGQENLARYWAVVGNRQKAYAALQRALDLGFGDIDFWNDREFEPLRHDAEFARIEAVIRRRIALH
jgi:serine/threonine protein kinase/tetratricopeptide (TPR) repeat protein